MLINQEDLPKADAAAVRGSAEVVALVTEDDLARPTPCAGWDLRALLTHMTVQHLGFAAAAEGRGADPAVWQLSSDNAPVVGSSRRPVIVDRCLAAADAVVAAFAAEDVLERPFALPELASGRTFPGRLAVSFHLVDYVVHGWDVAVTLGIDYQPPAELLALTRPIAAAVPGGAARLRPGAAFAPARAVEDGTGVLDEILLRLGRDPRWRPRKLSEGAATKEP